MEIAIIAGPGEAAAWSATVNESTRVLPIQSPEEASTDALLIDLLFDGTELRIAQLRAHKGPVWVADVTGLLPPRSGFVRINGWAGFEKSPAIEAAAPGDLHSVSESFAAALGKKIEWLPDRPGFVGPRVIAMIVNEAYHALAEGVSSKEEINTAMKLGTAYPHGPFEWAELIGLKKIAALLQALEKRQARYAPNALLLEEAGAHT